MRPLVILIALLWLPAVGQERHKSPLRYPATLAGIRPGKTTDSQVIKLYGAGYFARHEGHLGGRYFTDTRHRITLHIVLGVDRVVDEVEVQPGLVLPERTGPSATKAATTANLDPGKIRVGDFRLGAHETAMLAKYGKPASVKTSGVTDFVTYKTDIDSTLDVLYYEAHLTFAGGKLSGARLYNGE